MHLRAQLRGQLGELDHAVTRQTFGELAQRPAIGQRQLGIELQQRPRDEWPILDIRIGPIAAVLQQNVRATMIVIAARDEPARVAVAHAQRRARVLHSTIDMPRPDSPEFGTTFDLAEIVQEMHGEAEYTHDHGHAARTIVRADDLRVVLIAIRAGAHIAEHVAQATVAIQVLSGRVRIRLPRLARQHEDRFEELRPGRLLAMEGGLAHSVEALEESALLLTLGWRERAA